MFKITLLSVMKPTILVGGQAVIEGVMMRVPGAYATAVRDPNGKIHVEKKKYLSIGERSAFWRKPHFRGMAGLYESMKMGMETLQWSADIAMPTETNKPKNKLADFFFIAICYCSGNLTIYGGSDVVDNVFIGV